MTLLVFHRPTLFFAARLERKPSSSSSSLFTPCPSASAPFYARTSVDHPRRYVPPHRLSSRFPTTPARPAAAARDRRRRAAPARSRFDAARGTLTHPTPSRDAGRGATRLERRGATRRARATRRIRGKTRCRTASSSAAAETRSRVSPDRSRVTRRLGFREHHRIASSVFPTFQEARARLEARRERSSRVSILLRDRARRRPPSFSLFVHPR